MKRREEGGGNLGVQGHLTGPGSLCPDQVGTYILGCCAEFSVPNMEGMA